MFDSLFNELTFYSWSQKYFLHKKILLPPIMSHWLLDALNVLLSCTALTYWYYMKYI